MHRLADRLPDSSPDRSPDRSPVRLADIVGALGGTLHGDADTEIDRLAPLDRADARSLAFLAQARYAGQLATTAAACVILAPAFAEAGRARGAVIVCDDPGLFQFLAVTKM